MDVARAIANALSDLGVSRVYGIIGTSLIDFIDALYDYRQIRYISCRHEQVSSSMADAEGRLTGFPGVAIAHASPGTLNSAISVANAYKDGSPMVLIAGSVSRSLKGKNSMLEANQFEVMKPITMGCYRLEEPRKAVETIEKAFSIAINECGPVYVEIPEDLWRESCEYSKPKLKVSKTFASGEEVDRAAEIIKRSSRPLIVAGYGLNSAEGSKVLLELVDKTGIPVVTTGNGRGAISEEHEFCFGRVGFGGGSLHADKALKNSDCVICLGCQLSDITTYSYRMMPKGDIIAVTLDREAGSKLNYSLITYSDAVDFTKRLSEKLNYRVDKNWVEEIKNWKASWDGFLDQMSEMKYEGFANPNLFFKKLNERLGNAVVCAGQGMHVLYAQNYLKAKRPRSYLAATNHGAMGFGLSAGMTAKLLGYESIAVLGDGEFMMTIQDLETAVREKIAVKVVVVNDNSYRVLYFRQKFQKEGRIYGTLHTNPDFAKLAEIFGAEGFRVEKDSEIDEGIKLMLESDKPFVLDLLISPDSFAPINTEAISE
ncbi:MAG: thiamine pyrophosphate-binding protein [Archaeoglobaceae archaeon]|nr:thiamine pyrophosphate-binding protein [Archaeoglobaceae archaeon]MDW8117751.1 thiamine pyrophosphate-binding protein [Archaeoglobaceae archaeon]